MGVGIVIWAIITYRLFFTIEPDNVSAYQTAYSAVTTTVWFAAAGLFGWTGVRGALNKRWGGGQDGNNYPDS